jgi:hypothetical protein
MSEMAGADRLCRIQSRTGRSRSDSDRLRDSVTDYALEALGGRDAGLIVDETGAVEKPDQLREGRAIAAGLPARVAVNCQQASAADVMIDGIRPGGDSRFSCFSTLPLSLMIEWE